ncbi:nicotinamide riboside transporter PnuC [uncultured Methylophaga sp.]|jgi:nicotinamide mononucleotide transporter|uniref:nicotinamide riboside transporter PnuC n=1 Tax=uncultured Methylophaga sp. TaxID=285271 RepID=UPI00261D93A0|nr:nicotinamide riboside transporter PnuC [uncultured Methylophaga sp.]
MWDAILQGLMALSGWEVFAALLGVGYIVFAARESQWCWPMAFVSTLIYTLLFWDGQLPMQALLNFYYMGMAVYGFMLWRQHQQADNNIAIHNWPLSYNLAFLLTGGVLTAIIGFYLATSQTSQMPYLDAGITVFSVLNTWLMARKVLQNWLYWVFIDAAAIVLYLETGFYATVALFSLYTVLALAGFLNWTRLHRLQSA